MSADTENQSLSTRPRLTRLVARFAGVILAPRRMVVPNMIEGGAWAPILLLALGLAAVRLASLPEFLEPYQTAEFAQEYAQMRGLGPEKAASEIDLVRKALPAALVLESPVLIAVGVAFIAMIIQLLGRFIFKQFAPFIFIFRVVAWSSVVSVFPLALTLLMLLINPTGELPTNLGFFLNRKGIDPFISGFARGIDLFIIWQVALLAVAVSEVYKVSMQRAVQSVGSMYLILLLANVLLTAMPL